MYISLAAVAAVLGAVSAQVTTTELWLVGFDQQSLVGSVITSDATATTYSIECSDPNSDDCGVPASFTFTQGPSTIHYKYAFGEGDGSNETIELGCVITSSESGTCSGTVLAQIDSSSSTSAATTTSFSNGGSALGGQIVTITAGLAAAASTPASTTMSKSTGSSASSSKSAASTASQTAAKGSSSSSSAGVPKITGNAQWAVGGAAAAFAAALL